MLAWICDLCGKKITKTFHASNRASGVYCSSKCLDRAEGKYIRAAE